MRSFFEKLASSVRMSRPVEYTDESATKEPADILITRGYEQTEPEETVGELPIDMYITPSEIVIHTMIAGVRPEDVTIDSSRDMITISGTRREPRSIGKDQYMNQELYWGSFSRTIKLPEEIDADEIDATEKHGLLFIRLPKLDKNRQTRVKIKPL